MNEPLDESVWALLNAALDLYRDSRTATDRLRHHLDRLGEPLRVALAGPWQTGKSTLINAMVGEEIAPIEVADGHRLFVWYQDGLEPHAVAYPAGAELRVARSAGGGLSVDMGHWQPSLTNDVVVTWPARTLRHVTLVDTPAMPAGEGDGGLVMDKILEDADAVLYLTRDGRATDLRFLDRAQDGTVARAAPVNVLLVLARADELGGGRIDALVSARQLARRQHRDPRVGSRCLAVVAVSGLVAFAGRGLSQPDFAALATLAATPRAELEACLISTDRFTGAEFPAPVGVEARRALLERLGIFGVRLATTLIRTGSDSRAALAAELVRRAGLAELREAVTRYFADRRGVLKARSALVGLESVLRSEPRPGAEKLFARLEQLVAGAHDFRELRLLASLSGQRVRFEGEAAAEAGRLAGGNGIELPARLGVEPGADGSELWRLSCEALSRWQERAEDPLLTLEQRRAAGVVVRSCEGMLARLSEA